jgi:MFS family permease
MTNSPLASTPGLSDFRRSFLTMTAVDALGNGLFKAISVFFWIRYAHFSIAIVGLGFTLGGLSGMLLMLPVGRIADRLGQRRTAIVLNVVAGAVVATFPLVHVVVLFFVVVCLATAAEATIDPLRRAYLGARLAPGERRPFSARDRAVYNAGFGVGAALAGLGLALGDTRTLLYFVIADAASFLLAALPAGAATRRSPGARRGRRRLRRDPRRPGTSQGFRLGRGRRAACAPG